MTFTFSKEESTRFFDIIEEYDFTSQEKYLFYQYTTLGRLDVIRWLREIGCSWDRWVMAHAAWKGQLRLVKWLKYNGCPCDGLAINWAENSGYHNISRWLRANGCLETM